jgi:hypothetical protein
MHVWPLKYTMPIRRPTGFSYFPLVSIRHNNRVSHRTEATTEECFVYCKIYQIIGGGYFILAWCLYFNSESQSSGSKSGSKGSTQKGMVSKVSRRSTSWRPEAYLYFDLK